MELIQEMANNCHTIKPNSLFQTQQQVRVYDLSRQRMIKKVKVPSKWISTIAIHPGGEHFLVGGYDRKVIWCVHLLLFLFCVCAHCAVRAHYYYWNCLYNIFPQVWDGVHEPASDTALPQGGSEECCIPSQVSPLCHCCRWWSSCYIAWHSLWVSSTKICYYCIRGKFSFVLYERY